MNSISSFVNFILLWVTQVCHCHDYLLDSNDLHELSSKLQMNIKELVWGCQFATSNG